MTRSRGRNTQAWLAQVVHIQEPDVTSAANLVLLAKQYFAQDKSIYSDWRMCHIRKKWMRQQMKNPDALGGLTCAICGKQGLKPHPQENVPNNDMATLDHIVEISKGGKWNDPSNFQVACRQCNAHKNVKLQEA